MQDLDGSQKLFRESVEMKLVELSNKYHLAEHCFRHLSQIDYSENELVGQLTYSFMSLADTERTVTLHAEFSVPASWWDAFKLAYSLRWWFKLVFFLAAEPKMKLLSKHKEETVSVYAMLPDMRIEGVRDRIGFIWKGGSRPRREVITCNRCGHMWEARS